MRRLAAGSRRLVAGSATTAVLAALALTVVGAEPAVARTTDDPVPVYGAVRTVAGGGNGWNGPASFARLLGDLRTDAAPDGTLLTASVDGQQVLRIDPSTDRMSVVPGTEASAPRLTIRDVAADGTGLVVAASQGLLRIAADGTRTTLSTLPGLSRVDVGSDRVVWATDGTRVVRVLTDGTVTLTTDANAFRFIRDLTVTPDGSRAYVVDGGTDHVGVYQVTAAGVGPRVAGNGERASSAIVIGQHSTTVSTDLVFSLTSDGTTLWLSLRGDGRVIAIPASGGPTTLAATGLGFTIDRLGTGFALGGRTAAWTWQIDRHAADGTRLGRLAGEDAARPWSPDGSPAVGALLTDLRGAASLPRGITVFATQAGLVREVRTDGTLRTRATLTRMSATGKVALAPDGTAFVTTDDGAITRVPLSGASTVVGQRPGTVDLEVAADGSLLLADAGAEQLVRLRAGGVVEPVADLPFAPTDLALDGADVLVAGSGLVRVTPGGQVTTVLTGGSFQAVAPLPGGTFLDTGYSTGGRQVLLPSGATSPVRAESQWAVQTQAVDGGLLRSGWGEVRLVVDPGLAPQPVPPAVTATPGPGRIELTWDESTVSHVVVRAAQGSAPVDQWDGVGVDDPRTVLRIGGKPLAAGQDWWFSVFFQQSVPWHDPWVPQATSAPVVVRAAALVDDVPPPGPVAPRTWRTRTAAGATWSDPWGGDYSHSVARYLPGTTPPATPQDGQPLGDHGMVPDPVLGVDYAISVFTLDIHGNFTRWTGVTRLDVDPPGPVTDVRVTPSFRSAKVELTLPTDPDLTGYTYAVAEGDGVPERPPYSPNTRTTFWLHAPTMDRDYTLAVWTLDDLGNVGDPVLTRFRTALDTTPPGPVTDLTATGGAYAVTASWAPPTDGDLDTVTSVLVDPSTGKETAGPTSRAAASHTWPRLPGGRDFEVRVTSRDVNGLTTTTTAAVRTADDTNGAPVPIDPAKVTVTPLSATKVSVSFPKPVLPDLRSLGYAVIPAGASPDSVTSVTGISVPAASTVTTTVTLPGALVPAQLVLYVWDHNVNRGRSVVPHVVGVVTSADLPSAPSVTAATSSASNTLYVSWVQPNGSVPATQWVLTATSGTESRSVLLPGTTRSFTVRDLPGRRDWTATIAGRVELGTGPASTTPVVAVGDVVAPAVVGSLATTPSYDTQLVSWTNPTAFDLDRVVVTRHGATAAETKVLYQGRGTSVRDTGLVSGRSYRYVVETFDAHGNTASTPATVSTVHAAVSTSLPSGVAYGASARMSGTLLWKAAPLGNRTVTVQAQKVGTTTWAPAGTATTTSTGAWALTVKPTVSTRYRAGWAGSGAVAGAWSSTRTMTVAPKVSMTASRTVFVLGGTATLSTVVGPNHAGRVISLQRWTGTTWATVTTRTLSTSSAASASVRPAVRGTNSYRWVLPAHTDHGTGVSPTARLSVR